MLPESSDNPFYHLKARSLVLWGFLIAVGLTIALSLLTHLFRLSPDDPVFGLLLYISMMGLLSLWILRRFQYLRVQLRHIVGRSPDHWTWLKSLGLVLAILLFSAGAGFLLFALLASIAPEFTQNLLKEGVIQASPETKFPALYKVLFALVLVVIAPITEELIFRGVLLQRWAVKWGMRPALVASAIVFGVLHANVVGLTIFGLVMGLLYVKTRSLLVPIGCHALNNAIAAMSLLSNSQSTASESLDLKYFQTNWWVGLVLLGLALPWIVRFILQNFPDKSSAIPYLINAGRSTPSDPRS